MHGAYRITFISNISLIFFTYFIFIKNETTTYSANLWIYGHRQWSFGSLVPKVIKIFGRDSQDQYWLDFWIFGSDGGTVAGAAHTCDVFLIKSCFRLSRRRIVKIALLYTHWHHWCTSVPWLRRRIVNISNIYKSKYICTFAQTWAAIPNQDRIVNSAFVHTWAIPVLIRKQEQGQDQQHHPHQCCQDQQHHRHHCCQEEDHHHGCCQEEDGKIGLLWALVGQGWDGVTIVAI